MHKFHWTRDYIAEINTIHLYKIENNYINKYINILNKREKTEIEAQKVQLKENKKDVCPVGLKSNNQFKSSEDV